MPARIEHERSRRSEAGSYARHSGPVTAPVLAGLTALLFAACDSPVPSEPYRGAHTPFANPVPGVIQDSAADSVEVQHGGTYDCHWHGDGPADPEPDLLASGWHCIFTPDSGGGEQPVDNEGGGGSTAFWVPPMHGENVELLSPFEPRCPAPSGADDTHKAWCEGAPPTSEQLARFNEALIRIKAHGGCARYWRRRRKNCCTLTPYAYSRIYGTNTAENTTLQVRRLWAGTGRYSRHTWWMIPGSITRRPIMNTAWTGPSRTRWIMFGRMSMRVQIPVAT